MTYKDQYEAHTTWQEKVIVMNLFHCLQVAHFKKWTLKNTSTYFGVSIGLVSENLKLAKNLEAVKHYEFRDDAIYFLRSTQ